MLCAFSNFILNDQKFVFLAPVQGITSIGCSDNKSFICIHQAVPVGWTELLTIKATLPDKTIYGATDPVRPPQLLGEILILVQIMGIIHYLFIAGQEDENAYLPVAHKNAVSHPVTKWTVKDKLT